MRRMARKLGWLLVAVGLCGLFALCPLSKPFAPVFDSRYVPANNDPIPFDRDRWLAGKARHRVGMAHDLVNRTALDGMSRAAVVAMLGEPDVEQPGDEGMRWLLGYHAKGMFDESLWLAVTVFQDGTVYGGIVSVSWEDPRRR
jgi:hypothetical protein